VSICGFHDGFAARSSNGELAPLERGAKTPEERINYPEMQQSQNDASADVHPSSITSPPN
jgi:hypothetical protein